MIRLAVAEDHELVRMGLVQFLSSSPGIEMVVEAGNGAELLSKLSNASVDLLLLDMIMPGEHGSDLICHIKRIYPDLLILVLSGHEEISIVKCALEAGASGYISKNCSQQNLLFAINNVVNTGKYISPRVAEQLAYAFTSRKQDHIELVLSHRELQIFRLIVEGKSVAEIAEQLYISDKTVSTHKSHLLDKLGFNNVVDLVRYAFQHNLFS